MPVKNKKLTSKKNSQRNTAAKSKKPQKKLKIAAKKKPSSKAKPKTKTLKKKSAVKKPTIKAKKKLSTKTKVAKKIKPKKTSKTSKLSSKAKTKVKKALKTDKKTARSTKKPSAKSKKPSAIQIVRSSKQPSAGKAQIAKKPVPTKQSFSNIESGLTSKTKPSVAIAKPIKPIQTDKKMKKTLDQPFIKKAGQLTRGPVGFSPYASKSNEAYMNDSQLAHFQHVLNLWKQQILSDRGAIAQNMRDDTINFPDPLDRAALEEEHTLEWRAREREHRLILKIDQALAHIKQGEYGYCESCGAEIGIQRLEARPTATQCIDCKTINEIRERHTGTVE